MSTPRACRQPGDADAPRRTQRIPRAQRRNRAREFTLEPDVVAALDEHHARTGEPMSHTVCRALRRELRGTDFSGETTTSGPFSGSDDPPVG